MSSFLSGGNEQGLESCKVFQPVSWSADVTQKSRCDHGLTQLLRHRSGVSWAAMSSASPSPAGCLGAAGRATTTSTRCSSCGKRCAMPSRATAMRCSAPWRLRMPSSCLCLAWRMLLTCLELFLSDQNTEDGPPNLCRPPHGLCSSTSP